MQPPHEITRLLAQARETESEALAQLMPLVYNELRRIAGHYIRQERPGHTLQATALVNEAYLRLAEGGRSHFENSAHFFSTAAQLMRWILLDHARRHSARKRDAEDRSVVLEDLPAPNSARSAELLAIDEALERLEGVDPRQVRIVELRYFIGLDLDETAEVMGISRATVKREWAVAKAFLRHEIRDCTVPE
jgi:RNA polymerase sigma-70 factor (ECF subfamily)